MSLLRSTMPSNNCESRRATLGLGHMDSFSLGLSGGVTSYMLRSRGPSHESSCQQQQKKHQWQPSLKGPSKIIKTCRVTSPVKALGRKQAGHPPSPLDAPSHQRQQTHEPTAPTNTHFQVPPRSLEIHPTRLMSFCGARSRTSTEVRLLCLSP